VHEIAQARPARGESGKKRIPHGRDQPLAARPREAPGARARMHARPEQTFVRIDVSDSDDDVGVHQQLLDAHIAAARRPMEEFRGELLAERLDTEAREQRMAKGISAVPQHHPETARIAQAQGGAAENEVQMIVRSRGSLRLDDAQAPRHAQVHDERASFAFEQQIFSTPHDPSYEPADDEAGDIPLHAPAQVGVAHGDAGDGLAQNERFDAAAGDLNFGKLWHGGPHCPCRPFEIYLN